MAELLSSCTKAEAKLAVFFLVVLGMESKSSLMVIKHSGTEPRPQSQIGLSPLKDLSRSQELGISG